MRRLFGIGAAVLLAVTASLLVVLQQLHTDYIEDAKRELTTLNVSLAEQTVRAIESVDVILTGLAEHLRAENIQNAADFKALKSRQDTHEFLKAVISGLPQVAGLSMVAADGTLVNFSRQFPVPDLDLSDRDYFQAVEGVPPNQSVLTRPFRSRVSGAWTIYLARKVVGAGGEYMGLLIGIIELSYFQDFYRSLHHGEGSGISLWWRDGTLLARWPALDDKIGTVAASPGTLAMLGKADSATFEAYSSVDGQNRILSFQALRNYPLAVGVSRTRDVILEGWYRQAAVTATAGLVCLLAAALAMWALLRQVRAYEAVTRALSDRQQAIDEREEAHQHLLQLQRMEALGQLTGGVAHDFNNLLQAIRSSHHLIETRSSGEAVLGPLRVAQQALERGATLTQHLLAFSRRQQLAPKPVDLGGLVRTMAALLERALSASIQIEVEEEPGAWPALVDPDQFETALLNLALNARDAMPAGGTLAIRIANSRVPLAATPRPSGLPAGDYVVLTVQDTGTGMAEEVAARAFEPFFTTKPAMQSSGLGLSMVHGLAAQSGGGIELKSRLGHGTTVTLYLPRAQEALEAESLPRPEPAALEPAEQPAPRAVRVLLVEDNALVRMATAASLAETGLSVTEAEQAEEAQEMLLAGAEIDVLVTDFAMPGMNGLELARFARARHPGLPVLIVTGYAENVVLRTEMLESGVEVLTKPFNPEKLAARIDAATRAGDAAMAS
nr:response regulator [Azospirillum sp. SYSU D00513]